MIKLLDKFKMLFSNLTALLMGIIVVLMGVIKFLAFKNEAKNKKIDEITKDKEVLKENNKVEVFNEKTKSKANEVNKRLEDEQSKDIIKRPYVSNI